MQLLAMMAIRKLMDFVFTRSELYWLDHNLPGDERIQMEDEHAEMQARRYSQVRTAHPHTHLNTAVRLSSFHRKTNCN